MKRQSLRCLLGIGVLLGAVRVPAEAALLRCPRDSVQVGDACVDKYEASVWQIPAANTGLIRRVQLGRATLADLTNGGATQVSPATTCSPSFPQSFGANGNWTSPLFAVSVAGVPPTSCVTWFQAEQACALSGKRLLTNQEWQRAAAGTPDPVTDGATDCNIGGLGIPFDTGSTAKCNSSSGAFDMVGNVGEWVSDWVPQPTACPGWGAFSDDLMCLAGAGTTAKGPGALVRGGFFGAFEAAGVFAVDVAGPDQDESSIGFRCGRSGISTPATAPTLPCGTFLAKFGEGLLSQPELLAIDPSGNVFVPDTENHRIEKFTNEGAFLAEFGGMGTGDGQFNQPEAVAVDRSGNVFVADTGNHRIEKFTNSGAFLAQWGSLGTGDGQFSEPAAVAVDANGTVFVAERLNHRIQKFTNTGTFLGQWGSHGTGDGQFQEPIGVAVDNNMNVFVADHFNNRIQKFTNTGTFLAKWGSPGLQPGEFDLPESVAVDREGNVFVADDGGHVQKFANNGAFLTEWGGPGDGDGQFNQAIGVAVDANGNVYVSDFNNRVQKFACP